jgi:hypothetical protein
VALERAVRMLLETPSPTERAGQGDEPEDALQPQRRDARFWLTTYQIAANQLTNGVRMPAKIVPAVTEVSERQAAQRRSPSAICHQPPSTPPQNGLGKS